MVTHEQLQLAVQKHYPTAKVTWSKPLTGGISATVIALEVVFPNTRPQWWVLRVYGEADYKSNPDISYDEYRLLKLVQSKHLSVPTPKAYDTSTELLNAPYLLQQYVAGRVYKSIERWNRTQKSRLVAQLSGINRISSTEDDLSFLPTQQEIIENQLESQIYNNRIFDILKNVYPYIKANTDALLHGDFWLGNVIWESDLITVIDWEDAMFGDPLSDLGKFRLETLWVSNMDEVDYFTQIYEHQMSKTSNFSMTYLPFWDLWGAWRLRNFASWFDDPATIQRMQKQYDNFVDNATKQLEEMNI